MNKENKPLTAEEVLFTNVIGRIEDPLHELVIKAMNVYAAQQTAALREELDAARARLRLDREDAFDAVKREGQQHERISELEQALDKAHRQIDDKGGIIESLKQELNCMEKELESIAKERDKLLAWKSISKATARLWGKSLDRIDELESNAGIEWEGNYSEAAVQFDAMRAELAAECSAHKRTHVEWGRAVEDLEKELEAVKKERDSLAKLAKTVIEKALPKMARLDAFMIIHAEMYHFLNVVKEYRLSSGEAKPASPWISVEDRLPEDRQRIIALRDFTRWGSKVRKANEGHFYLAHENTRHGGPHSLVPQGVIPKGSHYWAFPCIDPPEVVTHWMPIPYLPETPSSSKPPENPDSCPHCTSNDVSPYGTNLQWFCKGCGKEFGNEILTSADSPAYEHLVRKIAEEMAKADHEILDARPWSGFTEIDKNVSIEWYVHIARIAVKHMANSYHDGYMSNYDGTEEKMWEDNCRREMVQQGLIPSPE